MVETKPVIFLIVGPTASGKTAVAIRAAKALDAEIISADSISVYRGMDIGSAKPTADEMEGVPHHLIDCAEIDDTSFNVAEYRRLAADKIREIRSRSKNVIIAGGTGLYVNSLVYPLNFSAAEPDFDRRRELEGIEAAESGALHRMLEAIDSASAARLHANDTKRIIRAIEVYERTGETLTSHGGDFANTRGEEIEFEPIIAGINMDRALLYRRIETRVDRMMEEGLLDEVDAILAKGYDPSLPALQGLGYKQLIMYRRGEISLGEAVELIKRDTRRFAKRQISWFKRDKRIRWFYADELGDRLADAVTEYFMTESNKEQKNVQ